ncbi:AAA family ATPase [Aestuariibacter sp. P117]|uniref:endopeptidase La n=2 Tax=Glaciecola petra TaxID=3075602 RepID=A0ABU2ZPF7_9ALTE|nr:AAA family ATPase [Aestuariibacter sp. P117]MDT0594509.1 AAA family ATPase [Aestuariibacter sp. P117]
MSESTLGEPSSAMQKKSSIAQKPSHVGGNEFGIQLQLHPEHLTATYDKSMLQIADEHQADTHMLIGQDRAKNALRFGLGVDVAGYNLYVMGEQATGRHTLVNEYITAHTKSCANAQVYDWCYLNNLENERQPISLALPPGDAKQLVNDIENFIDEVLATFPAVFENPSFQRKKASVTRHFEQKYDKAIDDVEQIAATKSIALIEEGNSISFSPIIDGKPLNDAEFTRKTDIDRQHYYQIIDELEKVLSEALIELPMWQRESAEQLKSLKQQTVEQGIRPLLKDLERQYKNNIAILKYLRQLKHHCIDMVIETLVIDSKDEKSDEYDKRALFVDTYVPNILVENKNDVPVPIIYEPNPSYQNIFGKIEYTSVQGSVYTNYRMITAGALHKANSGYLILDADKVLDNPHVWEALKLALKFGQIRMELPQQEVGMVNSITQMPEAIALQTKVILLGSRDLYYTLQEYDPEFSELFRVLVDFDHEISLNQTNVNQFVTRVKKQINQLNLKGIDISAMAALISYSLRQAEHQNKLSAKFADVIELLNEANFYCQEEHAAVLSEQHVEAALQAKKHRSGRVSDTFLQDIQEGHVLISTEGQSIGTINGLTVLEIGDTTFGTPARVTATVYAGSNGVVDIEREVELGQPIHSKGVLLLTGYLGNKYAQGFPLTLSANIALEQSYGYIDGDSASLAELLALISSLTEIPLQQGIAVTGSINQLGEVQAVGGVNEKIEGYFTLCESRGLTGQQGVIVPWSNHVNLMLNEKVREAVKNGLFTIYAVKNVDEAIEITSQKEAGKLNSRGRFARNSVHYCAINRLYAISNVVNGAHED